MLPERLKKGDRVGIISTARKIDRKKVSFAVSLLMEWGLVPVVGKTIGIGENQLAGSDTIRAQDFQEMWNDPSIKAIWCARGGYGTIRIIDAIDFSLKNKCAKWVIGYSDITVLHAHLHTLAIPSIHGPMPIDIHKCTLEAKMSLKNAVFGTPIKYQISSHKKNITGTGEGVLIGGNLSILYSLCGSVSSIDTKDKILCIEDLDEYLYHIDRMFQNLKRNKILEDLSGLIIGGMTQLHDNTIPFGMNAKEIILDVVKEYSYPVVFDFPMGHIKDNRALVFGVKAKMEVTTDQVLVMYK
ncbi:LD-carboxypeptidase [Aquimarina hainanensis]|uniref:LD-carboxypeptidase n=1 Tax=Aquimarina hainanensis TaxID=1578017 RepID=A0ABW5N5W8_9FLAO